jgi:hypothetical protein
MRQRLALLMAVSVFVLQPAFGGAPLATEKSWFGKFDLVEKTSGRWVRFFARHDGLSLFAKGDFKVILLQGYYTKARMSVGYRPISCPGGITGPCGRVDFVSVDAGNNF